MSKSEKNHHHHHHHYYDRRDRNGYAYRAGEPGPGPNFYRLRRDVNNRQIAGVCSGLSHHFGWNVDWLRFGWFLAAIFMFPVPIFVYIACAIFIKPDTGMTPFQEPEEERFWKKFSTKPSATFSELKHRFRALDARISDMEATVTSDEYGLRKAFDDLEKK